MRWRPRRWSAIALGLVVLVVAVRSTDARPSWAATAGACEGDSGVTVVVDFGSLGGGVQTRCAPEPVSSGFDALARAGFTYEGTARFPGLLCRIDDKPSAKQDACQNAPSPAFYWAYWTAPTPGGAWTYSDMGAGNRDPAPGSVDGWAFSDGCKRQPGAAQTCADATTTTAGGSSSNPPASGGAPVTEPRPGTAGELPAPSGADGPVGQQGEPTPDTDTTTSLARSSRDDEVSLGATPARTITPGSSVGDHGSPWGALLGGGVVTILAIVATLRRRRDGSATAVEGE